MLKKKKLEPVLIEKEEKLLEPNDTIQEEKEDLKTPDEIWKSFKTKVAERSPKWMMMIVNIKTVFYEPPVLKLEFLSTYDEGFFQDDSKLISQIKDYFNKFNMPVQKIETYVKNADLSSIENPVLYIKEIFKGEEI
ncbi:MAG TPA: hypothetical protein DHW82_08110 [Spirochaetia bacterium]|nr:hypothetical protein [Spirochaetia bacterium]